MTSRGKPYGQYDYYVDPKTGAWDAIPAVWGVQQHGPYPPAARSLPGYHASGRYMALQGGSNTRRRQVMVDRVTGVRVHTVTGLRTCLENPDGLALEPESLSAYFDRIEARGAARLAPLGLYEVSVEKFLRQFPVRNVRMFSPLEPLEVWGFDDEFVPVADPDTPERKP